jgi:hypothetical protein
MLEKKERERRRRKKEKGKKREVPGFGECFFSFLLKQWRNMTEPLPMLCRVTCKVSRTKGS